MFGRWHKKQRNGWRAGLVPGERETALAIVQHRPGQQPLLKHCGIHPDIEIRSEHVLSAFLQGKTLATTAVSGVMGMDDYQLLQVEAPEVPAAELNAAVRWKLREMLDFPVGEAVIDVFDTPKSQLRSQTRTLSAVAARAGAVQRLTDLMAPHAPGFDVIDIPELCLRNLCVMLPQDAKGVALLALGERNGGERSGGERYAYLLLTHQGVLYLTRRIELRAPTELNLDGSSDAAHGGSGIDAAALALELQRSLDYYESFFDQPPIGDLVLAPGDAKAKQLAAELVSEISLRTQLFAADYLFEVESSIELDIRWPGLLALGAAARVPDAS